MLFKIARSCWDTSFSLTARFCVRNLSTETQSPAAAKVANSSLYNLRKMTGYGLSKCREALEKTNGNVEQAAKYLDEMAQKEGWSKAEKLKNRSTTQGTLVLATNKINHQAALIEVNCETDFVARNEKFLELSSQLAISVLKNAQSSQPKHLLGKQDLLKLPFVNGSNSQTIGDQIALSIGSMGENMSLRRAVIFTVPPGHYLCWYMHGTMINPLNSCHFGKYGALVNLSITERNEKYKSQKPFDIGRQIAQQVVGMNPRTLGEMPSEKPVLAEGEVIKIADNETRLLHQEFLMKPETRVLDFLFENNALVHDFIRFECGEELPDQPAN